MRITHVGGPTALIELDEVADAGDVIAFLCKIRLRARTSGIELDSRLGQVFGSSAA